jgi:hypothetical protein
MWNIRLPFMCFVILGMLLGGCQEAQKSSQPRLENQSIAAPIKPKTQSSDSSKSQEKNTSPQKKGTIIGQAIDCNNDGKNNGYRIDYDNDGIPDDCITYDDDGNEIQITDDEKNTEAVAEDSDTSNPQALYNTRMSALEKLTEGCQENTKVEGDITYTACILNNRPVKASEYITELGDGLIIWFANGKVKAVQRTHNGETFFFDNGRLEVKFEDVGEKVFTTFSNEERNEFEELGRTSYQQIFQKFGYES